MPNQLIKMIRARGMMKKARDCNEQTRKYPMGDASAKQFGAQTLKAMQHGYSTNTHQFCSECHNEKYQYSKDFLYNVREKMFENVQESCHCCQDCALLDFNANEAEEWNEDRCQNYYQRSHQFRYEKRFRNQTPRTLLNISDPVRGSAQFRYLNSKKIHTTQTMLHELLNAQQYGNTTSDLACCTMERICDCEQRSTETMYETSTPRKFCWDKLSQNIWEMFTAVQQTEETFLKKIHVWDYLSSCIKSIPRVPKFELFLMGSTISGFAMDGSDIDMCIVAKDGPMYCDLRTESLDNLLHVKQFIENIPDANFKHIAIICAKVPILRFRHSKDDIDIELSFNNFVGIRNTQLLHCYAQLDWRVRPMVIIVKLWAKHHDFNDPKNSTLSSYSLALMVINFLQCGVKPVVLPCLQKTQPDKFSTPIKANNLKIFEHVKPFPTENNDNLGSLFYNFLKYYAEFDFAKYAISVRTGTILPLKECLWLYNNHKLNHSNLSYLFVEEPFNLTNTAKSVHDGYIFERIKSALAASRTALEINGGLYDAFEERLFSPASSST